MFWSLVEKVFQRGIAGILAFAVAWFVTPSEVGYYGVAISVVTLSLTVCDYPLRQIGTVIEASDLAAFDRTVRIMPLAAVPANVLAILLLGAFGASTSTVLGLLPLAFVPLFTSRSSSYVVRLQRGDAFNKIATAQVVATVSSLVVALPVLVWTRSVLGPSLQFALSEALMIILVKRALTIEQADAETSVHDVLRILRTSASTIATTVTSWGQLMADRVVMLWVAPASLIGSYSFASAIARLPNDVVTLAVVTVGRPRLAAARSLADSREWDHQCKTLFRTAGLLQLLAAVGLNFVLVPLVALTLPEAWNSALALTPLLILSAALNSLAWLLQMVLISTPSMKRAFQLQVLGAVLAVPVGLSASIGLTAVGYALLAREAIVVPLELYTLKSHVPRRSLIEWCMWMLCVVLVCAVAFRMDVTDLWG